MSFRDLSASACVRQTVVTKKLSLGPQSCEQSESRSEYHLRMNITPTRKDAVFTFLAVIASLASMVGCGASGAANNPPAKASSQQSAQLAVTPTTLNLGSVGVGSSGTATASLAATGGDVTVTSASSSNSRFALSGISLPLTIPAGQSAEFTVTFSPQTTGAASGTLTFSSNATPSSTINNLAATGTAAQTYTVQLSWAPSTSSNIVGYNIYRSPLGSECGAYARVNSALNPSTSFGDSSVADGQTYCYVTTAVNSSKQESSFSAPVEATVPAP
jgi:predicted small lipoprotein YifL